MLHGCCEIVGCVACVHIATQDPKDKQCPRCGGTLTIKLAYAVTGAFISCRSYPDCSYVRSLSTAKAEAANHAIFGTHDWHVLTAMYLHAALPMHILIPHTNMFVIMLTRRC